jgi:hypothetical protein
MQTEKTGTVKKWLPRGKQLNITSREPSDNQWAGKRAGVALPMSSGILQCSLSEMPDTTAAVSKPADNSWPHDDEEIDRVVCGRLSQLTFSTPLHSHHSASPRRSSTRWTTEGNDCPPRRARGPHFRPLVPTAGSWIPGSPGDVGARQQGQGHIGRGIEASPLFEAIVPPLARALHLHPPRQDNMQQHHSLPKRHLDTQPVADVSCIGGARSSTSGRPTDDPRSFASPVRYSVGSGGLSTAGSGLDTGGAGEFAAQSRVDMQHPCHL